MRELFGDLLPSSIVERATKANFDAIFWNRYSDATIRDWDGEGVDERLVDVDVLRGLWRADGYPPAQSASVFQQMWLTRDTRLSARSS